MAKYTKPRNFNPSQEDLKRVGRKVAENLSTDKVVVAGTEKIRGSKKKISDEVLIVKEDEMISITLSDENYEINNELLPVIEEVLGILDLSKIEDLKQIKAEDFLQEFEPLMNEFYGISDKSV
ncbi:MAG: hypothetical protein IAE62_03175 [Flavobacteriales bacterium]|nr:hypothetical protein [Flavobacteriales bacterium]